MFQIYIVNIKKVKKIIFTLMEKEKLLQKKYSAVFISSNGLENKAEYARRRKKLLSQLKSPLILAGIAREPGSEEKYTSTWNRLVQTPEFLYLTGINQAGCFLILDPTKEESKQETLFLPEKDTFKEFWTGLKLGVEANGNAEEASVLTGFDSIKFSCDLENYVKELLQSKEVQSLNTIFSPENKENHYRKFFKKLSKWAKSYQKNVENVAEIHISERLVLSDFQIAELKKAVGYTGDAFKAALKKWNTFKTERDLALRLDYEMLKRNYSDLAFPTIAASGENACCLHYVKNDEPLVEGNMVLLDFGARSGCVCADISRTVPVSRKYSPLQKLLYNIVLETQKFHESQVAPGKTLQELNDRAWDYLNEKLAEFCQKYEGSMELLYEKRPHGISHFIGEEVHEGGILNRKSLMNLPLKKGMLISNEPGVYGKFSATINGVFYSETLGIRIEDDLLLTEMGCENISKEIPKNIEDLEYILKS